MEVAKGNSQSMEIRGIIEKGQIFSLRELIHCRYSNKLNFMLNHLIDEQ